MNISQAKQIDLIEFLEEEGFTPVRGKGHVKWYISPIREENDCSFKVDSDRNEWYDYGIKKGGDIIDIVMSLYHVDTVSDALKILDKSYSQAVKKENRQHSGNPVHQVTTDMKDIQYLDLHHVALMSYLLKRKVNLDVAKIYCCEIHYNIKDSHYFGIAFRNRFDGFEIRNPYFKGCVGHKDITYVRAGLSTTRACILFEGFMDFLSYLTLKEVDDTKICLPYHCDIIVLNTVHNLDKAFFELKGYTEIHSYLDTDEAGVRTFNALREEFGDVAIDESYRYKPFNDLNDYLVKHK